MTVQQFGTGASSDRARYWQGIDWARCHREVRRLQARIVKANTGRQAWQGESLAMVADPLVQRQGTRRQASD